MRRGKDEPAKHMQAPNLTIEELFTAMPLYRAVPLEQLNSLSKRLEDDELQIDCHCIWCNSPSIFKRTHNRGIDLEQRLAGIVNEPLISQFTGYRMACQREKAHQYLFFFAIKGESFMKVGQYPSLEDITGVELQRFRSILDSGDYAELHRANGLASHGVGIGAFVYLRRIFERLILRCEKDWRATGEAMPDLGRLRMDEKIDALKSVLPATLVQNKSIYGILSSGVHELSEDTCREFFPVIKNAIVLILEQHLRAKEEQRLERELARSIQAMSSASKGRTP